MQLTSSHHLLTITEQVQFDKFFCDMVLPTSLRFCILVILPELTLKAKPIQEPKDWLTEKGNFLLEKEELVA